MAFSEGRSVSCLYFQPHRLTTLSSLLQQYIQSFKISFLFLILQRAEQTRQRAETTRIPLSCTK